MESKYINWNDGSRKKKLYKCDIKIYKQNEWHLNVYSNVYIFKVFMCDKNNLKSKKKEIP